MRAISLNEGRGEEAAAAGSRSPSAQRYQNFLQETQCQDLGVEGSAPGLAILYDMEAALGEAKSRVFPLLGCLASFPSSVCA